MIDFCTVVVLDFELKIVHLRANLLHLVAEVGYLGTVVEEPTRKAIKKTNFKVYVLHWGQAEKKQSNQLFIEERTKTGL